ncbi:hypothetical protein OEZ85_013748 [Tetradesmus obliquus]|uniref:Uncharacterized protein n=1 Tax=Tetradesmus obliquus TaxID=3088 RepID=A0ABY8U827_TETOB|nr:hypothetical protein OEZ85_013748 [Tetradesmus obliquus]
MGDHTFKVSNGAHNRGLALLGLVLLLGGALANDVVLEFLALDCHSRPVPGVTITLEGCVYRQDNDGKPFVVITDANGMAGFYRSPMVVQYCFGSASHLCSWSATKGGDTYVADITTLVNQTGAPTPITPHAFAGCKCDGSDECEPVLHYPLIVLKRSGCPCPSSAPNHPHNNNNDGDDDR